MLYSRIVLGIASEYVSFFKFPITDSFGRMQVVAVVLKEEDP
jgi:hypothetical protein